MNDDALKRWEERMARKPDDPEPPPPEPASEVTPAPEPVVDSSPATPPASDAASVGLPPLESLPPEVLAQALLLSLERGQAEGEIKACLDAPDMSTVVDVRWIAQVTKGGEGRISIFNGAGKELNPNQLFNFFLHVTQAIGGMPWVHERMRLMCKRTIQTHEELTAAMMRMAKAKA